MVDDGNCPVVASVTAVNTRLLIEALAVLTLLPPEPPPPPTDWANRPVELAPEVAMLPLLVTVTVPVVPPAPPTPPRESDNENGALVAETAVEAELELDPPLPPPPPTDWANRPMD